MKKYKIEDGITQSILSTWLGCRQAARFYLDGWRSDAPKRALQFGSLMHKLLEAYYTTGDPVEYVFDSIEDRWRKKAVEAGDDLQQVEMDLCLSRVLFQEYVKYYRAKDAKKEWLELEGVFDVDFNGYRLRGMTDGVYKQGKGTWILETKTASRIDEETLSDALLFNFQNLFYIVAKQIQLGKPVKGVLYNIIRKPSLRQKKNEPIGEFMQRIAEDVAARPDWYFVRFEIVYTRKRIKQFKDELQSKLGEFELWVRGKLPTYKNENTCVGRWSCRFLKACASNSMVGFNCNGVLFSELED